METTFSVNALEVGREAPDLLILFFWKPPHVEVIMLQVKLFVSRLKHDWDKLPSKMRKVYAWKDAVALHAVCGAFISLLSDLQGRVPGNDYSEAKPLLQSQFDLGYLDPEIENMLMQPPPAPGDVPFFRTKGRCDLSETYCFGLFFLMFL